jgi:hypothetical protein
MSLPNNEVKLVDPLYWNQFYAQIEYLATAKDVWHLVDPKGENENQKLELQRPKPVPGFRESIDDITQDTPSTATTGRASSRNAEIEAQTREHKRWKIYQEQERQYDREMIRYQKQLESLGTVRKEITNLTGSTWRLHIQNEKHPRDALIVLEKAIKPNNRKQDRQLESEFFTLIRGPNQKSTSSWLSRWTNLATHIKTRPDDRSFCISNYKLVEGFYEGLQEIDSQWATLQLQRHLEDEENETTLLESVDHYRRWNDRSKNRRTENKRTHSAMTATLNGETPDNNQQTKKAKTTCVCAYPHDWRKCYYFNRDGKERPETWKPTQAKIQEIKTTLEKDEKRRKAIERALGHEFDKYLDLKQPKDKLSTQDTDVVDHEANFLDTVHDFEVNYGHHAGEESSRDDFIIDSGANVHVTHNK